MKTTAKGGLESHENYKLPICNVDEERRNFDGGPYKHLCDLPYTDEGGTTETDSETAPRDPGYSSINNKYEHYGLPPHKGKQLSIKALGRGR